MTSTTSYEFGEVVLIDFPLSGSSKRKKRPALVILDVGDADVVLAPITTKSRSGPGDYKLANWQDCGLLRESWLRLAKVSTLEKSDLTRRLGKLSDQDRERVTQLWQALYVFPKTT